MFFHTNVCKHSSSLVYYSTKVKFVFKYVCQGFKNTHRALEIALYSTPLYGFQSFKLYRTGERTVEIFQRLKLTAVVLKGSHYSTAM